MIRGVLATLLLSVSVLLSACDAGYWCADGGGNPRFGQRGDDDHPCSDSEMILAGYEKVCGQIRSHAPECWWER
jgi:hypothetical protein